MQIKNLIAQLQTKVQWFTYADAYKGNAHNTTWATQLDSHDIKNYYNNMYL